MSATSDAGASVRLSIEAGIAHICFNSPQTLNSMGASMAKAFLEAVRELQASASARVLVLSGEGRAFIAGGDLGAFHSNLSAAVHTARAIIDPLHEAVALLATGKHPVIASVHGAVAGAGLSLAMGSDLVVAADSTTFVPAYAKIAASQDGGGSWALPRLVGLHKALEIMLLAEPFDAATALQLGIVNRVVPAADLAQTTQALARRLADGPTRAYGEIRRLLRASLHQTLPEQLAQERTSFAYCAGSQDFVEGVNAFFDKRSAQFLGT